MNKIKKVYLVFSIIFATVVVCYTLCSTGITVQATEYNDTQYGAANETYGATENAPNASDEVVGERNGFTLTFNGEDGNFSSTLRMLLVLTILTLSPSILIMLTSFTRCVIVLHFVRAAIGTNTAPPNQVLIGLALFLTLFIMSPVLTTIKTEAIDPFDAGEITQQEAIDAAIAPVREFMYGQTQTKDLNLFCDIAGITYEKDHYDDVPFTVVVPAFILSELRTAFIIGFLIYVPFIVIDMVVASVLMSMGMMMLPPTTISLPFKILLFVLVDGWDLVIGGLVKTFY
ncbi:MULTISPECIES: flagellar type III secretion system pore protein FliP [Pseudobutyrivibrio]|uniref:Flagellar biosynthetic protein FliP n=1 Tax=Pseudobutyrivibrio xylanivorans TaxID=185007 RepID=A0A1G5RYC9_PSEXY|nr:MULTISPECIES: flagellar type III secretion system pore protein FliP [Pseudobutyrivibrio]MDC7278211.1 flagellar type III secretion system pore protein FliP [Butyrivibrio fibrisolvens]SCZ78461.1 flagellar biosynthetic protein FliP [Pseudobutyrivibrio xylanivorans]